MKNEFKEKLVAFFDENMIAAIIYAGILIILVVALYIACNYDVYHWLKTH